MRLIIADDSIIVREGLSRLLTDTGHDIAMVVDRADTLPAAVAAHQPDAVIIDIRMPPTHTDEGLKAAGRLRTRHPQLGILLLSQYVVPEYATRLLSSSEQYTGYLLKDRILDPAQLTAALQRIAAGGTVVEPDLITLMLRSKQSDDPIGLLTDREREVLKLMAEGMSDKGIAAGMYISTNTVGTHTRHIFTKLGLPENTTNNRRVLAVLEYLQQASPPTGH